MPLPLRMSYNEEITTLSLARPCERSEAIQRISELDYKWIATASPRDDQLLLNRLRRPFHSWEFARIVCGHHFTVGNSAKLSYFHLKIIFYSLIKKENDKHNKT